MNDYIELKTESNALLCASGCLLPTLTNDAGVNGKSMSEGTLTSKQCHNTLATTLHPDHSTCAGGCLRFTTALLCATMRGVVLLLHRWM
jgi:hypothetical protein